MERVSILSALAVVYMSVGLFGIVKKQQVRPQDYNFAATRAIAATKSLSV
jgi:hypothetical protein